MRIVIFGIGKLYQRYKKNFRKDIEVVAFLDNAGKLNELDGLPVYKPEKIDKLEYDFIFILSVYEDEMRIQLVNLGVPILKIYGIESLGKFCVSEPTQYYGDWKLKNGDRNILMFSHAMNSTGAQNVLFITACELKKLGYGVIVISSSDGVLRERLADADIPVAIMKWQAVENDELRRIIEWTDKILINTYWLYYLVTEFAGCRKEIIWWLHELGGIPNMNRELLRYILEQPNVSVYSVSNVVKNAVEKVNGTNCKVRILTFGLPKYHITDKRKSNKTVFAIIGGIGYIKGQDIFVDAVAKLSERYRQRAEFWIVGGGKLPCDVKEKADRLLCIKILGEIDNRNIQDIYAQIDAVVCCSREEQMSVSVIEGLMNKKVVIVSDVAGIADVIEDGINGFIMRNEDIDNLTMIMMEIIDNPEIVDKISIEAERTFDRYFSLESFDDRLENLLGLEG